MTQQPTAPASLPPLTRGPSAAMILGIVGVALLAIASFGVIWFLNSQFENPAVTALSGILALIPLAFVVWVVWVLDRWEPEPRLALWFAALWGGIGAIGLTLLLNTFVLEPIASLFITTEEQGVFYQTVMQAPFTEELMKAIPVLIMFFFVRRHFDGPIDGMVIAALSAAGFAYTENILYFGRTWVESGDPTFVFFLRGIMSPLTHAVFTAVGTGLMMGIAATKGTRWWGLLFFPIGWAISASLHALWNSADWWVPFGMFGFFIYYFVVQVPLLVAVILLVIMLRRRETNLTRLRLTEYASKGWFSVDEVQSLSSGDGRAAFMSWARRRGLRARMRQYIVSATRLANARQRVIIGRDKLRAVEDEAQLLQEVADIRSHMAGQAMRPALVGAQQPMPQQPMQQPPVQPQQPMQQPHPTWQQPGQQQPQQPGEQRPRQQPGQQGWQPPTR